MSAVDPTIAAKAGLIAPIDQDSAIRTVGRGLQTAPILREGVTGDVPALDGDAARTVGWSLAGCRGNSMKWVDPCRPDIAVSDWSNIAVSRKPSDRYRACAAVIKVSVSSRAS